MKRPWIPALLSGGLLYGPAAMATNTVSVEDVSAEAGELSVAVDIQLTNDDLIGGFQFTLLYPSDILQVSEITQGAYAGDMSIFAATAATLGEVEALAAAMGACTFPACLYIGIRGLYGSSPRRACTLSAWSPRQACTRSARFQRPRPAPRCSHSGSSPAQPS